MHPELSHEVARERARQQREYVQRHRLQVLLRQARRNERKMALRARTVRLLFATAFALDNRESWRVFWERMSQGDRP